MTTPPEVTPCPHNCGQQLGALIHLVHYLNCNASVLKVHKEAFVCLHELCTQSHAPGQSSTSERVALIAFCHCSKVKQRNPAGHPFKAESEEERLENSF